MRLIFLYLMFLVSFGLFGQTTLEEYDYLTRDYARAIAMSDNPQKEGYYFENLLNMVDKSGKIMLLYKETQESLTPTATQVHVYDGPKTFYLCLPHDDSPKVVFDKHADDLQRMFEVSSTARINYAKVMKRYPIQLKKYFEEVRALEEKFLAQAELETPTREVANVEMPANTEVIEPRMNAEKTGRKPLVEIEPTKAPVITNKSPKKINTKPSSKKRSKSLLNARLKSRKVVEKPFIGNEVDAAGTVKVQICINAQGRVISAAFDKKGSNSRDEDLIAQGMLLAKQYRFTKSHRSRQCGSVLFSFR